MNNFCVVADYLPAQHQSKCDCKCDCLSKEEIAFVRRLMAQEKGKPDEKVLIVG